MRFAYIDSHGNEVPIPSVDALALRIELGAIGPETELYDAQADRWGQAQSHEIFHTLSRDAGGEGFVAPPPPIAPPPRAPHASTRVERPDPPPAGARIEATSIPEEEEEEEDTAFGLTLADAPPGREAGDDPLRTALDGVETAGLPLISDRAPDGSRPAAPQGSGGAVDFGDLSGGLELEPSPLEAEAGGPSAAMEFGRPADAGAGQSGGLELERPMSEFSPPASPMWMEQDGPGGGGDEGAMDFSPAASPAQAAATTAEGTTAEPRREPPQRKRSKSKGQPSRPRHRRSRSVVGHILSIVVLGAAGVGAYVTWPALSQRLGIDAEPPRPQVVIPVIPADLTPQMRALGDRALVDMFEEMDQRTSGPDVPLQPPEDWLFGVYLANASRFEEVSRFWTGISRFMSGLREAEAQLFHVKYLEAAKAEVAGDTVMMLTQRADSGFVAATAARAAAYGLMDDLVDAALGLHAFLLENEADIAYEPAASGISGDPLLEAVPSSDEVRVTMWDMLEDLTNALDALGTLDLVTRQELLDILLERTRDVAIQ